jgi:hypothetical protein
MVDAALTRWGAELAWPIDRVKANRKSRRILYLIKGCTLKLGFRSKKANIYKLWGLNIKAIKLFVLF